MSNEWSAVTLGDLLERVRRPVKVVPGSTYPAVSVMRDGQGLGDKDPFVGGETNYSTLFGVRTGDVVVRTITAFESPVGVARAEHDGAHVSQVFLTYEVGEDALPAYLAYVFQTPAFWWHMQNRAQGTVLRRKTISHEAFVGIPIQMPPFSVQRRIVDLLAHLDDHIANLRSEHSSLRRSRDSALHDALVGKMERTSSPSGDWRQATLGESAALVIGKTPPRNEPRYWTDDLTHPFCTIADMVGTRIDPSREGVTPDAIAEGKAKLVPAGALLMSFKLTIGRIGFASRDLFPNEAIVWIRSTDPDLDERFLALWLSSQDLSSGSGRAVKGETLNSDSLRAINVAIPPLPLQRDIVNLMADLDGHLVSLEGEIGALQMMRSDLLEGLLMRSVEIPVSYDHLLSEVA